MEVAKVTSKGQITIPRDIRVKMELKKGDKVLFFEENGKYFLQNSASIALKHFQKSMRGEAERVGFNSPDDVVNYIKSRRKIRNK
ncbi:MAG: AbrB/MazE/SpoVT family DNA-binding domain-containing protein [Treponema sp.]|jgi:AbrB family looped-hinge helix DNA binding protein|nr:AbrB/MazE/SpoVT family DNA-binding domain-containing protein [Treponema sp.]